MGTRDSYPQGTDRPGAAATTTPAEKPGAGTTPAALRTERPETTLKNGAREVGRQAEQAANQAQDVASDLTEQAQQKASEMVNAAQQQVQSQVSQQKMMMAESLGSMADALRQTGQQMRQQNSSQLPLDQLTDQAAAKIEEISEYLQNADLNDMARDVENFARREPTLFLGGAFLLGLLGARFLKSSRPPMQGPQYGGRSTAIVPRNASMYGNRPATPQGRMANRPTSGQPMNRPPTPGSGDITGRPRVVARQEPYTQGTGVARKDETPDTNTRSRQS